MQSKGLRLFRSHRSKRRSGSHRRRQGAGNGVKKIGGFFLILAALSELPVHAHTSVDLFWDSMAFAIQHFNASHDHDLQVFESEQKYMFQALQSIAASGPGLNQVTELNDLWKDRKDPFQHLVYVVQSDPSNATT